jgi:hypothetical protein
MSGVELQYVPESSPDYLPGKAGSTSFDGNLQPILNGSGQYVVKLQSDGLISEKEAYITIVHEPAHIANPAAEEADIEALALESGEGFMP